MSLVSQSNQPAELFSFTVNVILNYCVIYVYHLYPGELVFDTLLWACVPCDDVNYRRLSVVSVRVLSIFIGLVVHATSLFAHERPPAVSVCSV